MGFVPNVEAILKNCSSFPIVDHNGVRGGHIRKGGRAARIRKDIKFNQAVLAVISSAR